MVSNSTLYAAQMQKAVRDAMNCELPVVVCWCDASNSTVKTHFGDIMYPITAKNGELLIVQAFSAVPQEGAILGVQFKTLTAQVTCQLLCYLTAVAHI
jgi:hypothetical protein